MLKIYSKLSNTYVILSIKNYMFLLLLLIISCSVGNNSDVNNTSSTPISHNSDRQLSIPYCNESNANSPETQIAGGCINKQGSWLTRSVVGVAVPTSSGWELCGTGTIIDQSWILTVAHCVANPNNTKTRGRFYPDIKGLLVIPWQTSYNGIPINFTSATIPQVFKLEVKAIYISNNYAGFRESYYNPPYPIYVKDDFALLELENPLPTYYKSIKIESKPLNLQANTPLLTAGYGINESQKPDGRLRSLKEYFYSNLYNTEVPIWPSGIYGPSLISGANYGMIYTTGSIPNLNESGHLSAWSFTGKGDSGGPILYYNQQSQEFHILAIIMGGLYYDYAGFYKQLPYSFDQNTSMESSYPLIQSIINKTADRSKIRCISKNNTCSAKTVYVLNRGDNSITVYQMNQNNNLSYAQILQTGTNPYAFTFDHSHDYILVTNYGNPGSHGSISIFKIMDNGLLTANEPPEQLPDGINNPMGIVHGIGIGNNHNIYISNISAIDSNIFKLSIDHNTGALSLIESITIPNFSVSRIKLEDEALLAFDRTNNKIVILNQWPLTILGQINTNLAQPTDLSYITDGALITNFTNNTILEYFHNKSESSSGAGPIRIVQRKINSDSFVYVANAISDNIASFKLNNSGDLQFINTISASLQPSDMISFGTQLFVTNYLANSLLIYNILPDGTLELNQSLATRNGPIAVLVH